jgi:hypothetical protein
VCRETRVFATSRVPCVVASLSSLGARASCPLGLAMDTPTVTGLGGRMPALPGPVRLVRARLLLLPSPFGQGRNTVHQSAAAGGQFMQLKLIIQFAGGG